jgi:hypothetical protein
MAAVVCIAVATGGAVIPTAAAYPAGAQRQAALPSSRLEFGLSNFDSTWMTSSGVPWRYRFQYLSGGVNTGAGWETWNSPSGQFAADYMTNSTTSPANYIPVFTYYELLQSSPSTGGSELQRDFSNLNNAATMNAYYSNFKLLTQKAGAYGGQVVIHVEPDFWGYMQQQAGGAGATSVTAMVKSSGFAEASAYADNLAGFASELKFLRDTYAPNALLAMHASMWSSGIDIGSNTDATINAAGEADKTAAFLNSAGAGGWDAVFNDVDDHNAAWWELASCGTPPCVNQFYTHWWDPNNVKFPNFSRYLSWVGALHTQTGRPQIVWQVPMGNQYFLTMNNTCGHYQDNVAAYFIAHPSDLFSAGLVAVLFGAGNACQTSYDDSQTDGVTNNNGIPTTDQLGGCSACNTHTSTWADDDGGYLRIFVGNYYAGLSACATVGVTASPASPQSPGPLVQLAGTASGCTSPLFEFWILPPNGTWALAQPYSSTATFNWNTAGKPTGSYRFSVWARDAASPGTSGTPPNTYDAFNAFVYGLTGSSCSGMSASAAPPSSATAGTLVTVTGTASGCANPRYQFYLLPPGGTWTLVQAYSPSNTFSWNTAGSPAGSYRFSVWARDASSSSSYDAFSAFQYTLTTTACSAMSASAAPPTTAGVGTTVMVSGSATGCPTPLYQFWLLPPGGSWFVAQPYSPSNTLSWNTAGKAAGSYRFSVWARDAGSGSAYDAFSAFQYALTVSPCTGMSATASPPNTATRGTTVTITGSASGCPNALYEFWMLPPGGTWTLVKAYSASTTFTWNSTNQPAGSYRFSVWARDAGSSSSYDTFSAFNYPLT